MVAPPDEAHVEEDDALVLLFMCCHPALTRPSAIALTLRAVGGLTTTEIASAFLVPEATMAQRISRAKQSIKSEMTGRKITERCRSSASPSADDVWISSWAVEYVVSKSSDAPAIA